MHCLDGQPTYTAAWSRQIFSQNHLLNASSWVVDVVPTCTLHAAQLGPAQDGGRPAETMIMLCAQTTVGTSFSEVDVELKKQFMHHQATPVRLHSRQSCPGCLEFATVLLLKHQPIRHVFETASPLLQGCCRCTFSTRVTPGPSSAFNARQPPTARMTTACCCWTLELPQAACTMPSHSSRDGR